MKKTTNPNLIPAAPNAVAYLITSDENMKTTGVEVYPVIAWEIREGISGKYAHPVTPADVNSSCQEVYAFDSRSGAVFTAEHGVFGGIEELLDAVYSGVPWDTKVSKKISSKFGFACSETH